MSSDIAVKVENLSKCYHIYDHPRDRLKQFVLPRLQRATGNSYKQYFREFWALKDVSFEVQKGETVGIIGRNGSGKSTLLQIICGTLNPSSGSVKTKGRIAALLELGSGFNPEFTGRENVYMNASVLGLTVDEIDSRFDEIAAFADIGDFIEQPLKSYSSGMVVRLAFAVSINVAPDILIVDEALSVGDELFQRKCFSRIEAIRSNGSTILFVSHSGTQIIELCDRTVLIDSGEMVAIGPPKELVGLYQKLIYAPSGKTKEIRTEIIRKTLGAQLSGGTKDFLDVGVLLLDSHFAQSEETYDPNLVPSSTIDYESHGALINVPTILTEDGRKVNGLIRGRRYRYCYQVIFDKEATKVRFGMSIKSTTGFSLAGSFTAPNSAKAIPKVNKGSVIDVEFLFDCNLNSGVYFMNAGAFGAIGDNEVILHRRAEIIAFRVLPILENIETEIVSLAFEASVKLNAQTI